MWASAVWEQGGEHTTSYDQFLELFKCTFDHKPEGKEVGESLLSIKRGDRRVVEYTLEFCTVEAGSGWNEPALKAMFRQGLCPEVLSKMACQDEHLSLDALIDLAIHLDHRIQSRPSP